VRHFYDGLKQVLDNEGHPDGKIDKHHREIYMI
jgi:hypothetical protein